MFCYNWVLWTDTYNCFILFSLLFHGEFFLCSFDSKCFMCSKYIQAHLKILFVYSFVEYIYLHFHFMCSFTSKVNFLWKYIIGGLMHSSSLYLDLWICLYSRLFLVSLDILPFLLLIHSFIYFFPLTYDLVALYILYTYIYINTCI